jgi:hypothetical protein
VERDWASREFVIRIYQAIGSNEEEVDGKIIELMGQGKGSENIARLLFPSDTSSAHRSLHFQLILQEF